MVTRNPYRGLMIKAPRSGHAPLRIARAVLPAPSWQRAQAVLRSSSLTIVVSQRLLDLEQGWFMMILPEWVVFTFAPRSGVGQAASNRITVAAGLVTTPIPWAGEDQKIRALGNQLPVALKHRFC